MYFPLALLLFLQPAHAANRIVSLAPSCAEIVAGLGLAKNLVGITQQTDYPPEILNLPQVGSYIHLNLEAILNLQPDLVIATNDGNPPEILKKLGSLNIPLLVLDLKTYDSIQQSILQLGKALDRIHEAEMLVAEMQRVAHCISNKTRDVHHVKLLFLYQIDPMVSPGRGTITDELIEIAGGASVTHDFPFSYPHLSIEQVIRLNPELFILSTMGDQQEQKVLEDQWRSLSSISVLQHRKVYAINTTNLDRPSQRIVIGLYQLAKLIHPELFQNSECEP